MDRDGDNALIGCQSEVLTSYHRLHHPYWFSSDDKVGFDFDGWEGMVDEVSGGYASD